MRSYIPNYGTNITYFHLITCTVKLSHKSQVMQCQDSLLMQNCIFQRLTFFLHSSFFCPLTTFSLTIKMWTMNTHFYDFTCHKVASVQDVWVCKMQRELDEMAKNKVPVQQSVIRITRFQLQERRAGKKTERHSLHRNWMLIFFKMQVLFYKNLTKHHILCPWFHVVRFSTCFSSFCAGPTLKVEEKAS